MSEYGADLERVWDYTPSQSHQLSTVIEKRKKREALVQMTVIRLALGGSEADVKKAFADSPKKKGKISFGDSPSSMPGIKYEKR